MKSFFYILAAIMLTTALSGCKGTISQVFPSDPLLEAAANGDADRIRYLINSEGRDVNY